MGEIADMVLEGLIDEQTHEYIGDRNIELFGEEAPGFPITYENGNPLQTVLETLNSTPTTKIPCWKCGKCVKPAGMADHNRDVHGEKNGK